MKKQTTILLAAIALASTSIAGTTVVSSKESKQLVATSSFFQDQEVALDLFYSHNNAVRGGQNGYFQDQNGGGVGVTAFFARYFGVGVEGNWFEGGPSDSVLHQVTGNLILRYPIELNCFGVAPYVFGGGGGVFDGKRTSFLDAGAGLEVRVTPRIGIFSDWRYNFMSSDRGDLSTTRAGVRFVF